MAQVTLNQILEKLIEVGLTPTLQGDGAKVVDSVASLEDAQENQLGFLNDAKYLAALETTKAGCVLLNTKNAANYSGTAIILENPYAGYAYAAQLIYPKQASGSIHPTASIAEDVSLGRGVTVGANAVIGRGVTIEVGGVVGAGCVLEENVSLGANTRLEPNVTIMHSCQIGSNCVINSGAVIGGEGFGFAKHKGEWISIPQVGRVIIGSNVSIGNNTTIDRGAIKDTLIGDNCIIDNLVHLAHNVEVGEGSVIIALVGVSGSTKIGKNCTLAGQVGTVGHVAIADDVTLMARAGVTKSIKKAGVYAGFPAEPFIQWQKNSIHLKNLPKMNKQLKELNKKLDK